MRANHEPELRGGPLNLSVEWQLGDRLIALTERDRAKEKEDDKSDIQVNEERGSPYNHLGPPVKYNAIQYDISTINSTSFPILMPQRLVESVVYCTSLLYFTPLCI